MGKFLAGLAALAALAGVSQAALDVEWSQRAIYQVITDRFALPDGSTDGPCDLDKYCGGTWSGLINKLDYIQGMGFTAVLISPVVKNIPDDTQYGEAYHGYWPVDNYALNDHFGDADDLKNLSKELHDRGMYLMVDVVINNMAQKINGSMPQPIDYAAFNPFNDEKYFHPYCNITDFDNTTNAQNCWLGATAVALPDLDTQSKDVISLTQTWIKELVANYSIDGLRIDAAKHIGDNFWAPFLDAAGVFAMGEVYTNFVDEQCRLQKQNLLSGLENFVEYFFMLSSFTSGDMLSLSAAKKNVSNECNSTATLATFGENQDLERFASMVDDIALAQNMLAYIVLNDGIPLVYMGQEQHLQGNFSPYNRQNFWTTNYNVNAPLYNATATYNRIRNHAIGVDSRYASNHSQELYVDNSTMCNRKGPEGVQIVSCFSNQGSKGGSYNLSVPSGFKPGTQVIEITNCTRSTANSAGNVTAEMGMGQPKVFFPVQNMNGSGLCGFSEDKTSGTGGSNGSSTSSGASPSGTGKHQKGNAAVTDPRVGTIALGVLFALGAWLL